MAKDINWTKGGVKRCDKYCCCIILISTTKPASFARRKCGVPEDPTTGQLEQEEEVGQFGEVLDDEQEDEEDDAKLDQLEPESVPMPATSSRMN
uniref:Uncharacterized protein n=1 Tax=Ditylenchus dipsaci TaxID=166011 RepID=A0A915E5F3_9BILA